MKIKTSISRSALLRSLLIKELEANSTGLSEYDLDLRKNTLRDIEKSLNKNPLWVETH